MKTKITLFFLAVVFCASANAGSSGSAIAANQGTSLFKDNEFMVDIFGSYYLAETRKNGTNGNHGWGGGLGLNYFFWRYVGVGLEGSLYDVRSDNRAVSFLNANFFIRYPIEWKICFAPYVFGGCGGEFARINSAHGQAGFGVEFRLTPTVGVFTDARYTWTGGPRANNDFGSFRTGMRFVF